MGQIQADGSFRMVTSADILGVVPGEYQIFVESYTGREGIDPDNPVGPMNPDTRRSPENGAADASSRPKPAIPTRYFYPETSGLIDSVNDQHSGTKNIDLVD